MTFAPDAIKTIITHAHCADGLVSAMLLKDVYLDANIRFMQYQTEELRNLQPEEGMIFVDFCPWGETEKTAPFALTEAGRANIQRFVDAGVKVLDHHKTARETVAMFGDNGRFGDEITNPGICGATLAYAHVWAPKMLNQTPPKFLGTWVPDFVQDFARLAGIRDTWQKKSPDWTEACIQKYVLDFYPEEEWLEMSMTTVCGDWRNRYRPIGELLLKKEQKGVERALRGAYRFTTTKGTRVVMFEGVKKTSDAAEVATDADIVVGFNMWIEDNAKEPIPSLIFSTRSRGGYDVSAFCKTLGGGGHTAAAGCKDAMVIVHPRTGRDPITDKHMSQRPPTMNPYFVFWNLLETYEHETAGKKSYP